MHDEVIPEKTDSMFQILHYYKINIYFNLIILP